MKTTPIKIYLVNKPIPDKKEFVIRKQSINNENYKKAVSAEDYFFYKNFQIIKLGNTRQILGRGAFAEVVLVKSKIDGKKYAMKIIEKKKASSIDYIKQEILIHLHLSHENVIKLYSYSETKDFYYLLMEYASKGNVYSEIKAKSTFDEDIARHYFIQTIKGIAYLHNLGYGHRDIKPENLLIDCNDTIKICDFGGCVRFDEEGRKTFFGTYEYMAPEVIEGSNYNRSVDIWALGILLYELLHGYSPFRIIERKENMKEYYQIYENIVYTEELLIKNSVSEEAAHLIKSKCII